MNNSLSIKYTESFTSIQIGKKLNPSQPQARSSVICSKKKFEIHDYV